MLKEYQTVTNIYGPLMLVEKIDDARFGHIVDIELGDGSIRHGQILQVEKDKVLVQVFEGTSGIDVDQSTVRFLGKPLTFEFEIAFREKPGSAAFSFQIMDDQGKPIAHLWLFDSEQEWS